MNISRIQCDNSEHLNKYSANNLKKICRQYELNDHGTKITLCNRIKNYLKNITGKHYLNINNITKIHSIYDLVRILDIDDLSQLHDLDMYEVEFLFNELQQEFPGMDKEMKKLIKQYHQKDVKRSDIDVKMLLISHYLGKMICECTKKYEPIYGTKTGEICERTVFRNKNVRVDQYKCDKKSATILPKFGSTKIIGYVD
jgi:hypothetical protein